jgi:outer membrane protein assembly factor BamC
MRLRLHYSMITLALLSGGCSTIGNLMDSDTGIDYKSSKTTNKLEVPPDLTQLRTTDRFSAARNASAANQAGAFGANSAVLPSSSKASMERIGNTRYLVVNLPAEQVYPELAAFWKDSGFNLTIENPATGILETDWAENRSKLPQSGLRRILGGVLDSLHDSGERDMFRTRIERAATNPQSTEIYISHRGTKEVSNNTGSGSAIQMINRDGSAELEADFLRRIMLRFTGGSAAGSSTTAMATGGASAFAAPAAKARLNASKTALELDDNYDTAWRRLGLALDRGGFTTEDRNFATGEYYIRYARNPNDASQGFLSKMFSFSTEAKHYSKKLKLVLQKGDKPTVLVQNETGGAAEADVVRNVLEVLQDELK